MMANTENIEAKLCAYVDGELDPAGRAEIEAHLSGNPQHRQLMDELMRQRELLAALPRERAPEDLFEAMTNQLERSVLLDGDGGSPGAGGAGGASAGPAVAGRINQWPQVFAAAAVLLLAVGLAAVIYFVLPAQNPADYARVTPPPAAAPSGVSGDLASRARTLNGSDAATGPIELADGGTADRVESKSPAAKAAPSDADTMAGAGGVAVTAPGPTAIAAGPAPSLPPAAAMPATPEPPSPDPFSKSAVVQTKPGASAPGVAADMKNMFADAQINEKLKASPGVPDNSMLVVVNADNPSIANQQIQEYFANNGIKWEPVAEPMPEPLDLQQSQTVHRTRLADTQMRLKGGAPPAASDFDGMEGFGGTSATGSAGAAVGGGGGTAGQQGARDAASGQREQAVARADDADAAQRRMKEDTAVAQQQEAPQQQQQQQDKQFADQSKLSRPAAPPYPARKDAAGAAPPPAVVDAAQQRDNGTDVGAAGTSTGAGAGAGAGAQASKMPTDTAPREAETESAQQPPPRDETARAESRQLQQQQAAAAPRLEQQQRQPQQELVLQQSGRPQQQQQQSQQQPFGAQQQLGMQQGQQAQPHQVFIARGLTKQQVLAMNNAFANGNRIANYSRAGDTITPATLPSIDQSFTLQSPQAAASQPADALAKTEGDAARSYSRATELAPTTLPTGGALAATTQPTTAALDRAWDEERKRLAATTAPVATTTPSTAPTGTQAMAPPAGGVVGGAAGPGEDLVDVVILVQGEDAATGFEQVPQQQAAPNAAAVDVPSPGTTSPATTPAEPGAAATFPASAPAPAPAPAPF